MWEIVFPVLGLGYLAYVFGVQIIGQEAPYTYFPILAGIWCLVGLVVVFVRPDLAQRIGDRLTREDLDT